MNASDWVRVRVLVEPVVIRCAADNEDVGGVGLKLRRKRNRATQVEADEHDRGVSTSACARADQGHNRRIRKQCLPIVLDECQAGLADRDHQVESPSAGTCGRGTRATPPDSRRRKARDIDGLAVIVQASGKTVTNDFLKVAVDAERNGRVLPQRVEHDDAFLRAALSERRINKDERRTNKCEPDRGGSSHRLRHVMLKRGCHHSARWRRGHARIINAPRPTAFRGSARVISCV